MDQPGKHIDALLTDLISYGIQWPAESETVNRFRQLLESEGGSDPFRRERLDGHFTGSAWLVSADRQRAALLHHRKLDRWLQPGGHADGERDLAAVALR
ncbi:MAG: NUDIX hydrolase, partial [Pseudoxanthomonas sp.]